MQEKITLHELDDRFKSINDPHLRADVTYVVGNGRPGWWLLANGLSDSTKLRYRATAVLAGELHTPGSGEPFTVWLDALKKNSKHFFPALQAVNEDGTYEGLPRFGTIERVCKASADLCCELEVERTQPMRVDLGGAIGREGNPWMP
jgi:hypothetical protein